MMGRMEEPKTCTVCDKPLTGNQTLYCSRRCRDTACYARRLGLMRRLRISWTRVCVASVSERKVSHGREELTVRESPRPRWPTRGGGALERCPQAWGGAAAGAW